MRVRKPAGVRPHEPAAATTPHRRAGLMTVSLLGLICCNTEPSPSAVPAQTRPSPAPPPNSVTSPQAAAAVTFGTRDGPRWVQVEVVNTPAKIRRGLMYREHLAPDHGMLFVFADEKVRTFWMKNTLISLDMIFLDGNKQVVGIVPNAEPRTTVSQRVDKPSRYVVEVNAGWAAKHNVVVGTQASFDDF